MRDIEIGASCFLASLLCRRSLTFSGCFAGLCFFSKALFLLVCLLSLVLCKSLSLELLLLFLGLKTEFFLNLLTAVLLEDLVRASNISLEIVVELVHSVWVGVQNLDVIDIVVTETLLDLIEQVEALLKSFVQLNVMNSLFHLFNFNLKFVFLVGNELVKGVAGLGERNLEVYLSQLQLLLVIVHTRAEILVEVDNVRADLSHLVNGVIHIIDGVGVQSL